MKVGYPNNPRVNIIKEIKWIGKNKFDFIDLTLEEDKATPERVNVKEIKRLAKKYNLDLIVGHASLYLQIGSPVKHLREAVVAELTRYFKTFSEIGVKFVTVHSHYPILFSDNEGIKFQVDTLKKLVKKAKEFGIKIMYEPGTSFSDTVENVSKVLRSVPKLLLNLDIGHVNLFGKNPVRFIKKFYKKIVHVHLHDNNGVADLHLPIGCGIINWKEVIRELKAYYDGTITLEVFSRDREYVLISRKKLLKLWKEL